MSRIFSNPATLHELLKLYKIGWSTTALADKFACHHTSILYQIQKHDLLLPRRRKIGTKATKVLYFPLFFFKETKYSKLLNEPKCGGKSYRHYLEEAKYRDQLKKLSTLQSKSSSSTLSYLHVEITERSTQSSEEPR